jgi:hypothetical protein
MRTLLAVLLLSAPLSHADTFDGDFCELLRDLGAGKLGAEARKEAAAGLEVRARAHDPRLAAPAILLLWGKDVSFEALWWEKDERLSRALIASLYLTTQEDAPDFSAFSFRFRPEEGEQRRGELSFVKDHLSAIASLLTQAEKNLGLTHHKSYERLRATAREATGEPLRCVPDLQSRALEPTTSERALF